MGNTGLGWMCTLGYSATPSRVGYVQRLNTIEIMNIV